MGIFDRNTNIEQMPILDSQMSHEVRDAIAAGMLPSVVCDAVQMNPSEQCRYAEPAIFEKKVRVPRASTRGGDKGMFRRRKKESTGAPGADSIVDIAFTQIRGNLYITDARVVFQAAEDGFERKLVELLAVKPYLNCVKLQFGKDSYKVFVPDGALVHTLLGMLREHQ